MNNNLRIAEVFNQIADILETQKENPFRIRAYRRAAQTIDALSEDVGEIARKGGLTSLGGIGVDLAGKIQEFIDTGKILFFERLKKKISPAFLDLIGIPGVGPRTAKALIERLKIKGIRDLEKRARAHQLAGIPGIRKKTEENILKAIQVVKKGKERVSIGMAFPVAREVAEALKGAAKGGKVEICGSLRRRKETIRDIDILVSSLRPAGVMDAFVKSPLIKRVLAHGLTKSSAIIKEGLQVDVRVVEPRSLGAALLYFTGSKEHNIRLRELAVRKGLKINEYGVFSARTKKWICGATEEEIYKVLGLRFIPPELREDRGEIAAARAGKLPRLVEPKDIKGDFHVHTEASDGTNSIDELVKAAMDLDYGYIAITDHSQSLTVTGGQKPRELLRQIAAIRKINSRLRGFRVLAGAEVDILDDGTLDFKDEILSQLDIVVAALHSGFKQSREKLTRRITKAMQNRYVHIISHLTGRLMGAREAYAVDMEEIFKVARDTNTALEINAFPTRLDLDDANARRASEAGVSLAIGTDTHSAAQLSNMQYGLSVARRGWLEKKDLLNSFSASEILEKIKK